MSTPELASFKPEPKKSNTKFVWAFLAFVAFVAGIWIGTGIGGNEAAAPAAAKPAQTVTTTVNETTAVEVTPQVCLDALGYADEGFSIASEALFAAQRVVEAILSEDLGGAEQANNDIASAADKLRPLSDRYNDAKVDCRTAAK